MYLKSIEISGFKSFARKTRFEFPHGITGIVGPNGSGKSNIGDAVRWVLGEQSAKQLRGARMEDVIFSGTETRRPMGYAYVAITFDNTAHMIPVDYEEVTVARRVYRSGESEYILNGTSCRRKDIVELFYDTGIGKEGYSIIGQGQVEKILSGKIEDSRELFDEAAGIAKYKKNRAATQKSLDQERQNLERVTDILSELSRQVGPLEEQSQKAKSYLKLRDKEKDLDLHLFLYDYKKLSLEIDEMEKNAGLIGKDLEEARKDYEQIKVKNNVISSKADKLDEKMELEQETRDQLRESCDEKERESLVFHNQISANDQMRDHFKEIAVNEKARISDMEEQIANQAKKQDQCVTDLEKEEKDLGSILEEIEEKTGLRNGIEAKIRTRNQEMLDRMSEHTDRKEQLSRCRTMEEQIHIRNAEYNSRLLESESEKAACGKEIENLKQQIQEAGSQADHLKEKTDQAAREEDRAYKERKEWEQEKEMTHRTYLNARSRYEALHSMSDRYEGYNRASRYIMEQKKKHPEILGVVADIMTLDRRYETAIEIALGGALQYIVTEDNHIARKMIDELKKNRLGRATFLPLTDVRRRNISFSPAILEDEGVIGVASQLVSAEDKYRNLVGSLLGRTIVVDTVEHALNLSRKNNFSLRLVTLDGELLSPGGSITGGAWKKDTNLLGRRRELAEAKESMEAALRDQEKAEKDYEGKKARHKETKESLQAANEALRGARLKAHDLENQLPPFERKYKETQDQIDSLRREQDILKEELREILIQIEELSRDQEDSEAQREKEDLSIRDLTGQLEVLNGEISRLEEGRNEANLRISALRQEMEYLASDLARLEEEIDRSRQNREENLQSAAKLEEENQAIRRKIDQLAAEKKELAGKLESIEDSLKERKNQRAEFSRQQRILIQEMEDGNSRLLSLEKEYSRLTARKDKLSENLQTLIDYMWETYEETYNHALSLSQYEIDDREVSSCRKEKKEIRKEIRDLGPVNVHAIEEFREVGERYEFLKKQHEDILGAEARLMTMIDELNKAMRQQFTERFGEIRSMFTQVFVNLFEGGTADLELMDEDDILECGIRITAQPPGKKLQNILLLSGGERALTAIALLFAIQNLKPSPFCFLDEIEAALDDANIGRFARYLRLLSKDTQFIVITHRKGTMNAADSLYGITMQEKGVSTLISVDLIDKELK